MKLTTEHLVTPPGQRLVLEYTDHEIARAQFDDLDLALFSDLEESNDVTIADRLLGLERIARRIEESS